MESITSHLLASSYASFSPALQAMASVCRLNGQEVACPPLLDVGLLAIPLFVIFIVLIMFIAGWKIFEKAQQPGWAYLIPIYNMIVMLEIIKKPTWWIILCFLPFVNIVIIFMIMQELSRAFGKGTLFGIGLIFLPFIFLPILAFDKSTYQLTNQI